MILGAGFIWCLPTLLRKGGEAHYENQNFHNKSVKAHFVILHLVIVLLLVVYIMTQK